MSPARNLPEGRAASKNAAGFGCTLNRTRDNAEEWVKVHNRYMWALPRKGGGRIRTGITVRRRAKDSGRQRRGSDGSAGPRREGRSAVVGEGFVSQEHVPGRRFYVIFAVLLATALLLGFYVASRSRWEGGAWSTVWIWLLAAGAAGLAAPDLASTPSCDASERGHGA